MSAKVICDSLSPHGVRLTTMEVTFHRFVLAEFNTHRMLSRNSASSRAIPLHKQIARLRQSLAFPVIWASEKPGMQGGDEIDDVDTAAMIWNAAADDMVGHALRLQELRVHKSVVNRLLEPFMWHTVIVTATEWKNFFELRCHEMAQPEIRAVAEQMRNAMAMSTPTQLAVGDWHLPYVDEDLPVLEQQMVSVARCAWVSTMSHDGEHTLEACQRMYDRLTTAEPMHASPLEHQARPIYEDEEQIGNLIGWRQLRHMVEGHEPTQDLRQFFDSIHDRPKEFNDELIVEPLRAGREGDTQPMPIATDHPVAHRMVQDDLEARLQLGISRYGQPLQPFNGRDSLRDAYEEILDMAVYIRNELFERENPQ